MWPWHSRLYAIVIQSGVYGMASSASLARVTGFFMFPEIEALENGRLLLEEQSFHMHYLKRGKLSEANI